MTKSSRLGRSLALLATFSSLLLLGCGGGGSGAEGPASPGDTLTPAARLQRLVGTLAADSLEGRATGTRGSAMAADFIALELESYGLEPAFPSGFLQPVSLVRSVDSRGRVRIRLAEAEGGTGDEAGEALGDVNVGAVIRGRDPELRGEVVIVGAHFDHLGIRPPRPGSPAEAEGDSIYNGADDDATGVAAVLEVARRFAREGPAARSVLFLLTTGEELGLLGTRGYLRAPAFPLDSTVADLQVEMIGRPDSLIGGRGKLWLTGYQRSTLGPTLAASGLPVYPTPYPDDRFFYGSDNIAYAYEGIPAHTFSSFNLHGDYHTPDDEADRLDYQHMAEAVVVIARAVRLVADGEPPQWTEGGRPQRRGG